ncbi:MAG: alpha/beta fold hydrolase [Rhodospirillaceae bacterium]|nr:alpha/beta fold hydrolase [Rhodospirillaceae bacterium]
MIDVYFGTNRDPLPVRDPRDFGHQLNNRGSFLRFGKAQVSDELDRVEEIAVAPERLRPSRRSQLLSSNTIFAEIRARMRAGVDTVLFIHGFDYSFHEALIDAALLKRTYETAETSYTFFVFSWPSDGSLMPYIAYANDRADARTSGAALGRGLLKLGEFVRRVSDELGPRVRSDLGRDAETARLRKELCAGRLHLMAHSMGGYVLRHAVQGMRREIGDDLPRLFDEILLIAVDEDADAFEHDHKLALLPRLARRVTVYHNREDIPLAISDLTKGNPDRLGADGPAHPHLLPAKVTVVDCTDVVEGFQEHRFHKGNDVIVDDIRVALLGGPAYLIKNRTFMIEANSHRLSAGN